MKRNSHTATLERLVNGREVFVYASEFGPHHPVLTGATACLPFYRPWETMTRCRYFNGRVGIQSNLMELLASGHLPDLRAAFAANPPPRSRGLPWPHAAFPAILAEDATTAQRILRQPHTNVARAVGIVAWLQAATYWAHVFRNEEMTHLCLDHFRDILMEPEIRFLKTSSQLRTWISLLDDPREILPFLYETLRSGECYHIQGAPWAQLATVFAEQFNDTLWSRHCLEMAAITGYSKAKLALLSAGLFPTPHKPASLHGKNSASLPDELLTRSVYFRLVFDKPGEAQRQLEAVRSSSLDWKTDVAIANAWLLLLDSRKQAEQVLHQAGSRPITEEAILARIILPFEMLGNKLDTDLHLLKAATSTQNARHLCDVAALYLDTFKDEPSCRILLRRAEDLADSCEILCHCAEAWIRQIGDRSAAQRCLGKAIRTMRRPKEHILCATTAIRLFNDVAKANRLMARSFRSPRP